MAQARTKSDQKEIKIALTGNPNSGKTTIFNHLTGFHQRVGNYPGVTVEKKEGLVLYEGHHLQIVDLPGIYSLTPYSPEELITRRVLLEEKPDVVIDVLDATNIERNLYLATQLKELGVPLVLALNMSDEARAQGIQFDLQKLSTLLGVPIVPTVGHKREGIGELLAAAVEVANATRDWREVKINYGRDIETELENIQRVVEEEGLLNGSYDARWVSVKLLEGDQDIIERVRADRVLTVSEEASRRLQKLLGDPPSVLIPDRRYGFISGACQEAVRITVEARHNMSDRIDEVIMNGALGIPILLLMMYLVFNFTFTLGDPPMQAIEWAFVGLSGLITSVWPEGTASLLRSLLVDGIIGGVGGVVVFLPNILLLFLAIAMLEDTGYMARAAFIMDRLMHRIGLHGKSFIPLLIGFGCSIPAIMATRTLESRRDRLVTMLITPLMSCGARLTIYALIIPAFFPRAWQAPVLWIIYVSGILLAIISAKLLRKTLFRGSSEPFVMELPPYRIPTAKSVVIHMWDRGKQYLRKAGTIILGISIVLWAFTTFPRRTVFSAEYNSEVESAQAAYGQGVAELCARLGLTQEGALWLAGALENPASAGEPAAGVPEQDKEAAAGFLKVLERLEAAREGSPAATDKIDPEQTSVGLSAAFYLDQVKAPYAEHMLQADRRKHTEQLSYSLAGRIGRGLAVVLQPIGLDWKVSTALIGAFAAKEVFVAQMGIIYAVEDGDGGTRTLREQLRADYTPLGAICILLFCLIGTPCMATLAVTRKESGSWGWALLQWGGLTVMAYIITFIVYQTGLLFGLGRV